MVQIGRNWRSRKKIEVFGEKKRVTGNGQDCWHANHRRVQIVDFALIGEVIKADLFDRTVLLQRSWTLLR